MTSTAAVPPIIASGVMFTALASALIWVSHSFWMVGCAKIATAIADGAKVATAAA